MRTTHDEVELELLVADIGEPAEQVRALTLVRSDGGRLPTWTAGAHIDLELGVGLVRQYSLYGDPADAHVWNVAVLLDEHSRGGSAYVYGELAPGMTLRARGPRNLFPLVEAARHVVVAGGIGITPLLPMIRALDAEGSDWSLVYGGRSRPRMAFADGLSERYGDRVRLLPEDETGLLPVSDIFRAIRPGTAVYCCGPEGLIAAVEKEHAETGRGTLHVERFSPRVLDEPVRSLTFEVEAARSGAVVTVGPEISILAALDSIGVRVLSSCAEGICGTCEVLVVEGEPDHRDSILTEEERERGETMFVCVSRCLSPRLVLDI